MPRKSRTKKITVRVASELREKGELGKLAKEGKDNKDSKEGMIIERFIVPILKQPLQSLQASFQPLQLQPLPLQPLPSEPKKSDASIHELKQLLNDEKARILATVKTKKPVSLYHLAKLLKRDFKAVRDDVKTLEKFGFIKLVSEKVKGKKRLKPVLALDKLQVTIEI